MKSAQFTGRIAHNLELKQTNSGTPYIKFSIAVSEGKDEVEYFDFEAWKNTAEFIARYFEKGKPIALVCTPKIDKWEGKDGKQKSKVIFRVENAGFCGGDKKNDYKDIEVDEEDLPF